MSGKRTERRQQGLGLSSSGPGRWERVAGRQGTKAESAGEWCVPEWGEFRLQHRMHGEVWLEGGWERWSVVSGQTTEAVVWGEPKGSGLHLWPWGVRGTAIGGDAQELW